jgi:hypothetical protein
LTTLGDSFAIRFPFCSSLIEEDEQQQQQQHPAGKVAHHYFFFIKIVYDGDVPGTGTTVTPQYCTAEVCTAGIPGTGTYVRVGYAEQFLALEYKKILNGCDK